MKPLSFTDALRTSILEFEGGHNELARRTKVPQPTITRFVNGADMMLSTADRLAGYLGVRVARDKSAKRSGKSG
jgi:plasmid maintenance system antidote protein VapI